MLTERDRKIIRFIDDFGCTNTTNIYRLFFSGASLRRCQDRLEQLAEHHHIARSRNGITAEYIYYIGKQPQQIQHSLIRAAFYARMKQSYNLTTFEPEFQYDKIRADAYTEFKLFGERYGAFVEIQLSSGNLQEKYEKLYQSGTWQKQWDSFPLVIIVTNRRQNIKPSKIKYIVMDSDRMSMDVIRNSLINNVVQYNTRRVAQ